MATFLLTWNPSQYVIDDDEYTQEVLDISKNGESVGRWSTGSRKQGISPGDVGLLVRQHRDRGIVGAGTFTTRIYQDKHYTDRRRKANYADVRWTSWLALDDRLPVEVLKAEVPEVAWDRLQGSGVRVPDTAEVRLLDLWMAHLHDIGKPPEEVPPGVYPEGAAQKVLVNRYERSPQARLECIERYGPICAVCGFDFGAAYGDLGDGYIEVHHLKEVSTLPKGYQVNPIKDLRPVCANCHAMLHRQRPALSISALKKRLAAQR